jgi:hypothetical protein
MASRIVLPKPKSTDRHRAMMAARASNVHKVKKLIHVARQITLDLASGNEKIFGL